MFSGLSCRSYDTSHGWQAPVNEETTLLQEQKQHMARMAGQLLCFLGAFVCEPIYTYLYFLGSFRMASPGSYWRGYTSNHIRILHSESPPGALWLPSGGLLGGCPCIGHSVDYLRPISLSTVRGETQGITGSGDLNGQIPHNPLWKVIPKAAIPLWGTEKEMIISKKRSAHSLLPVVC